MTQVALTEGVYVCKKCGGWHVVESVSCSECGHEMLVNSTPECFHCGGIELDNYHDLHRIDPANIALFNRPRRG